jgi:hypothetical protein
LPFRRCGAFWRFIAFVDVHFRWFIVHGFPPSFSMLFLSFLKSIHTEVRRWDASAPPSGPDRVRKSTR